MDSNENGGAMPRRSIKSISRYKIKEIIDLKVLKGLY